MRSFYPQPGDVLAGRFRVVRTLGRGGMGLVLEAENTVTARRVALKWLHPQLAESGEATERLVREATAAARVRHPNVVDVYDVLQDGGAVFLVMELLEGEPLDALLRRGRLPAHELVPLLLPAMEGVAEAHRQQIIHRDIHPANIFLARVGRGARPVPKVLDFGISKLGGTQRPALTNSNMSMGTPLYMSYEQLYSARDVDERTDVYAFGVILYQGLTGTRPFDGDSFLEIAGQITTGTPLHPRTLVPEIPEALAELVLRAMARDREARIGSIEALMRELAPFAGTHASPGRALVDPGEGTTRGSATSETVDTLGRFSSRPVTAAPRRRRLRAAGAPLLLGASLAGLLLLGIALWVSGPPATPAAGGAASAGEPPEGPAAREAQAPAVSGERASQKPMAHRPAAPAPPQAEAEADAGIGSAAPQAGASIPPRTKPRAPVKPIAPKVDRRAGELRSEDL